VSHARTTVKESWSFATLLLFLILGGACLWGQTPQQHDPSKSRAIPRPAAKVVGYLAGEEPGFADILPPVPEIGSLTDEIDVATLRRWQQPDNSARWQLANADEQMSYNRFSQAFGIEISSSGMPLLVNLLSRTLRDVQDVAFSAKDFYNRPRPFQRFQMEHVCGAKKAPAPEVPLKGGSSYPSGHMSFAWATVLILADVAPEHAQALLARGREYGESRVVCAVHYPSDLVGGQLVATAVVARLHSDAEFKKDLTCAKEEHSVALHPGEELSRSCRQRQAQLGQAPAPTAQSLPIIPWPGCTVDPSDFSKPCALMLQSLQQAPTYSHP
jgi:acid phosphatase (class A)